MLAAATTAPFLAVKTTTTTTTTTKSSEVMKITAAIKATEKGRIPNCKQQQQLCTRSS